jgi:hypothetical protein
MHDEVHRHAAIRANRHATVYQLLSASAVQHGPLPLGTEGAIGRAQSDYDCESEAAALLRDMNLTVYRLRQAQLAGAGEDVRTQRATLGKLADAWFYHATLLHIPELLPTEGAA